MSVEKTNAAVCSARGCRDGRGDRSLPQPRSAKANAIKAFPGILSQSFRFIASLNRNAKGSFTFSALKQHSVRPHLATSRNELRLCSRFRHVGHQFGITQVADCTAACISASGWIDARFNAHSTVCPLPLPSCSNACF